MYFEILFFATKANRGNSNFTLRRRLLLRWSMGNLVVTFLWDPIPSRDQQIIEELRLLAKKYSLSEAEFHDREYEEGKTIFGAENAGFWRLVISDDNVDNFSREGAKVLSRYKIGEDSWRMVRINLAM